MPVYCYSTPDGRIEEVVYRMGEAPPTITLEDGRVAERDFFAEQNPRKSIAQWPFECLASGVNAAQAGELREFFRSKGESVEVTRDGNPVYTSPAHRRRLLKMRNLHDNNSF